MTQSEWFLRRLKDKLQYKLEIKVEKENFGGRKTCKPQVVAVRMGEMLRNEVPFSLGRMGLVELTWLRDQEQKDDIGRVFWGRKDEGNGWGLIEENRRQFVKLVRNAYSYIDILSNWYIPDLDEDIFIRKYAGENVMLTDSFITCPFLLDPVWTKFLKGKKVLVISPFTDEIAHQYQIREKLFKSPDVLPEFELKLYKAIWIQDYIDQHQCTFQDVYNKYLEDIFEIDFDVALISCSVPSFLLAAEIKRRGKIGIQMGGVLQMLFGIKGKRFDSMPHLNCFYNEYWIRPQSDNKPSDAEKLDNFCYW